MRCAGAVAALLLAAVAGGGGCASPAAEAARAPADPGGLAAYAKRVLAEAEARLRAGRPGAAEPLARRALEAAERTGDAGVHAAARGVLGHVLFARGDEDAARPVLEAALGEARAAGATPVEVAVRMNLGNLERVGGGLDAALAHYAAAEGLAAGSADPVGVARAAASGLRARARDAPPGDPRALWSSEGRAAVTSARARIAALADARAQGPLALHAARSVAIALEGPSTASERDAGDRTAAEPGVADELSTHAGALLALGAAAARDAADPALASEVAGERGRLAHLRGDDETALAWTSRALLASERAGSEARRIRWHLQAASLHRAAGDLAAALEQQGAAVSLLERHRPALAGGTDAATAYRDYVDLLLLAARGAEDAEERRRRLLRARDVLEASKAAELRDYFGDECVDRARARIRRVEEVSSRTLVLYPVVLPDRLELLVSGGFGIEQRRIPVGEEQLRAATSRLRRLLTRRTTHQYRRPARTLHDWLIGPIDDLLRAHRIDTLVFVPDGILRTIPLAALHDGERFLVERLAVATTPGIELTDPRPIARDDLRVLLGGLSEARGGYEPLPYVTAELARVRSLVGGDLLLDEAFRTDQVAGRIRETDFDLVHLATHAEFDRRSSSGFLLTWDGRLGLDALSDALAGDRYRERPLELLVLSACETARGDERAALGLSGIAIQAGARSAVGSLWRVSDRAASELLVTFYRALREPDTSRAQALRRAQLALIEAERYRHPAYWSAFLLINSWL